MRNILGGKILYIEDEVEKLFNTAFLKLFDAFFSDDEKRKLKKLSGDELISTQKIKDVLKESNNLVIEIEDTFLGALKHIKKMGRGDEYALCICDRNLWSADQNKRYKKEDVQKIIVGYDDNEFERYRTWEGDFLLLLLALQGFDCTSKFYFLSAYSDEIASKMYLDCLFSSNRFGKDNFISKGDQISEDKFIKNHLRNATKARILTEYREIFKILESHDELTDSRDLFMNILSTPKTVLDVYPEKMDVYSGKIRPELEKIVNKIHNKYSSIRDCNVKDVSGNRLYDKIQSLNEKGKLPEPIFFHMDFIRKFENKYGNHPPAIEEKRIISHYTILSLVNSFFEILIWYNKEMKKSNFQS